MRLQVANQDSAIGLHKPGAQFALEVVPPVGDLRMDRLDPVLLVGALRNGQLLFQSAIELLCLNDGAVARGRKLPQTQIDANRLGE
jgi:hypothetical protein